MKVNGRFFAVLLLLWAPSFVHAQTHTFIFLNSRTDKAELPKDELDKIMQGHMKNIERLASENKLLVAGPFEGGGGIFIMNTPSVATAQEWLSTDPGVKADRWRIEILPYYPRVGSVCKVGENYEMITYQFIRFHPAITKFNATTYTEAFRKHDHYLRQIIGDARVATEATFGNNEGGILVVNGAIDSGVLDADPAVKEGVITVEVKKLWVAKGSFCE